MSGAAFHTLEVTVLSAEDLTANHRPIKSKAFASLRTEDRGGGPSTHCSGSKSYSTRINEDGGQSPSWNEKLTVKLPVSSTGVVVEVLRKGSSGDRMVGMARIPKSDFTGEYSVPVTNHLHFLSYRLRDPRGVKNGIINVAVRVTSSCSSTAGLGVFHAAQYKTSGHGGERMVIGYPMARWPTSS
ncbi:hypothetical protein MLD38_018294 [Melastoma candidum]|uniref:Uncharacterized protein n=1 Tax=Melastoma candidum TaxID=119954 RepID=A0ACB9QTJ8_9MYRT|nr:hypothetical protein MLD38_018294 [Melastoma candidum]